MGNTAKRIIKAWAGMTKGGICYMLKEGEGWVSGETEKKGMLQLMALALK